MLRPGIVTFGRNFKPNGRAIWTSQNAIDFGLFQREAEIYIKSGKVLPLGEKLKAMEAKFSSSAFDDKIAQEMSELRRKWEDLSSLKSSLDDVVEMFEMSDQDNDDNGRQDCLQILKELCEKIRHARLNNALEASP